MNILQIITENQKATGGKCGITMVKLCEKTGMEYPTLKPLLKELHTEGKIKVREGINLKLIFPLAPEGGIKKQPSNN